MAVAAASTGIQTTHLGAPGRFSAPAESHPSRICRHPPRFRGCESPACLQPGLAQEDTGASACEISFLVTEEGPVRGTEGSEGAASLQYRSQPPPLAGASSGTLGKTLPVP